MPKPGRRAAIEQREARCGLSDVGRKLIGTLSKGYQQRVGIAQAIVHEPDVVILDEPTVGLDPNQIREIRALIRELGGAHSVILSTHILPEVEAICDRVQIMHHGSIVYSDTIAALQGVPQRAHDRARLAPAAAGAELAAVPGVTAVESVDPHRFRLQFAERDPTEELVAPLRATKLGALSAFARADAASKTFSSISRTKEPNWMVLTIARRS